MSNAERLDTFEAAVEEKLEPVLRPVEHAVDETVEAMPAKARSILGGDWLGHPLHPMLTDLPIGFWTSSFLLDFAGKRAACTSTAMTGLGIATAAPTIAAGVAEFAKLPDEKKHTAAVHMVCNAIRDGALHAVVRGADEEDARSRCRCSASSAPRSRAPVATSAARSRSKTPPRPSTPNEAAATCRPTAAPLRVERRGGTG